MASMAPSTHFGSDDVFSQQKRNHSKIQSEQNNTFFSSMNIGSSFSRGSRSKSIRGDQYNPSQNNNNNNNNESNLLHNKKTSFLSSKAISLSNINFTASNTQGPTFSANMNDDLNLASLDRLSPSLKRTLLFSGGFITPMLPYEYQQEIEFLMNTYY